MFFPSGTPKDVIAKLNSEILKALKSPDVANFISGEDGEPVGSTPEALATMFKREVERYAKIIKAANIKPE